VAEIVAEHLNNLVEAIDRQEQTFLVRTELQRIELSMLAQRKILRAVDEKVNPVTRLDPNEERIEKQLTDEYTETEAAINSLKTFSEQLVAMCGVTN
jgi:hypothetical protein